MFIKIGGVLQERERTNVSRNFWEVGGVLQERERTNVKTEIQFASPT